MASISPDIIRNPYIGTNGNWYVWDSSAYNFVDTGVSATGPQGEMAKATYDPTNKSSDAFDMDNMAQGTSKKYVSAAELAILQTTSRKNILHNWDFRNPVDQRGGSPYSGAVQYTIDRWKAGSANLTVTVNGSSIQLASASGTLEFFQYIENYADYDGLTMCLSVDIGGTIYQCTGTYDASATETVCYNEFVTGSYILLGATTGNSLRATLLIGDGQTISDIRRVKLELGSVSTLANDPPADYGEQLLKCQRYYQKIYGNFMCYATVADTLRVFFPLSPKMRTSNPTIISMGFEWAIWGGGGYLDGSAVTIDSFSVIAGMDSGVDVAIIFTTSSLETTQKPYFSRVSAAFSADL